MAMTSVLTSGQWGYPIQGLGSYGGAEEKKPSFMRFTSEQPEGRGARSRRRRAPSCKSLRASGRPAGGSGTPPPAPAVAPWSRRPSAGHWPRAPPPQTPEPAPPPLASDLSAPPRVSPRRPPAEAARVGGRPGPEPEPSPPNLCLGRGFGERRERGRRPRPAEA